MSNTIIYTDIINGLHILSDGIVVEVDGYPNEIKQYGRLVDNKNYHTGNILDVRGSARLASFNYNTRIIKYSYRGILKLADMDIHRERKEIFEDKIIKYLKYKNKEFISILLDDPVVNIDAEFLKYMPSNILKIVLSYVIPNRLVAVDIDYKDGKLEYSYTTTRDIRRPEVYGMGYPYSSDTGLLFTIGTFRKEYETMGLELAPAIEETKQNDYPETKEDLDKLLEPIKLKSYGRGKPTIYGDGCTMMDKIKNIDVESLYPKTTINSNLSIDKDKIINAYNTFIYNMLNIEKYIGISIRVPRDYNDDWFKILPCFNSMKESAHGIQDDLDRYVNIKRIGSGDSKNYAFDISGLDSTSASINDNSNRIQFSACDIILNLNITDLQTRLIDLIIEDKPSIVDSDDEVNVNYKLVSEVKDNDSKVSETDSKPIEETISHRNIDNAYKLLYNIITSSDYIRHGKIPAGAIEYITLLVNGDKGIPNPNKIDNTGYTIRKVYPAQSTFKRLSESDILDKLTVNDIVDNSELNLLKDVYDKHMGIVSIRCENDRNKLDNNYRSIFKKHIDKGVLYPKLKFNYDYGYNLNENGIIEYGITRAQIAPFKSMISTKSINIHNDIAEKYSVLIKTQSNISSVSTLSNPIDEYQVESCISIYKSIFSKYIELGILKDNLIFTLAKDGYIFPSLWDIYSDGYVNQDKPIRLYNIYLNIVLSFSNSMDLRYCKTTLDDIYKSMFKRYIEVGLMKSEIEYSAGLPFPTIDKLWLHR